MTHRSGSQISLIKGLLANGGSITWAQAMPLGIARLADIIHKLRERDHMLIVTEMKTDLKGSKYAEYSRYDAKKHFSKLLDGTASV